jgi:hypothetical protein
MTLIMDVDATIGTCPLCGHEENEDPSGDEEDSDKSKLPLWPDRSIVFSGKNDHELNESSIIILLATTNISPKNEFCTQLYFNFC